MTSHNDSQTTLNDTKHTSTSNSTTSTHHDRTIDDSYRDEPSNRGNNYDDTNEHNPQHNTSTSNHQQTSSKVRKIIVAIILLLFIAFIIIDSFTNGYVLDTTTAFLDWVQDNPTAGFFAFVFVYFAATILFVPGSILTLGCGFIFANAFGLALGLLIASFAVFVGASAGATVAFLLGRFLLREWVKSLTLKYPIFKAIDSALEGNGLRIMILLRLSPIIPFNALNYIAGVTAVSIRDYVWALVSILPGTVFYVFLGASAGSLTDSRSSGSGGVATIVSIGVGIVFGILAIGMTSYYAKKELNKVIEEKEVSEGDQQQQQDEEEEEEEEEGEEEQQEEPHNEGEDNA